MVVPLRPKPVIKTGRSIGFNTCVTVGSSLDLDLVFIPNDIDVPFVSKRFSVHFSCESGQFWSPAELSGRTVRDVTQKEGSA